MTEAAQSAVRTAPTAGDPSAEPTVAPQRQSTLAVGMLALLALGLSTEEWLWPGAVLTALLASVVIPGRLPDFRAVGWVLRAIAFAALFATETEMRRGTPVNNFVPFFKLVGRCCAAEMVIRAWQPTGLGVGALPLSAMVMLPVVFGPARGVLTWGVVPAYLLMMVVVTRSHRPGVAHRATARRLPARIYVSDGGVRPGGGHRHGWLTPAVWGTLICLPSAFALGFLWADTIDDNSLRIRTWLTGVDLEGPGTGSGVGFSPAPRIGPAPGPRPSLTRVLRVEGTTQGLHLRAASFDRFEGGSWGPPFTQRQPLREVGDLHSDAVGPQIAITRLHDDLGNMVFAPLHAAGLALPRGVTARADPRDGGSLRAGNRAPFRYEVVLPKPTAAEHQGPLCVPPTAAELDRLRQPMPISAELRHLIWQLADGRSTPRGKIDAVVAHLTTRHAYSLFAQVDPANPVEDFVLRGRPGHCELFATAAVVMLRELGVPARYVVGFYAHEPARGGLVVRQRDAHAWAEAWVEGSGWVTVEATAAEGLPDSRFRHEPAPAEQRLAEWWDDSVSAVQAALDRFDWQWWGLAVGIPVLAAAAAWGWWRTRQFNNDSGHAEYWSPGPQWAELADRLDRLLTQYVGCPCPPGRTWEQHLSHWRAEPALAKLLVDYRAARFGRPNDDAARRQLFDQLALWEARVSNTAVSQSAVTRFAAPDHHD